MYQIKNCVAYSGHIHVCGPLKGRKIYDAFGSNSGGRRHVYMRQCPIEKNDQARLKMNLDKSIVTFFTFNQSFLSASEKYKETKKIINKINLSFIIAQTATNTTFKNLGSSDDRASKYVLSVGSSEISQYEKKISSC